MNCRQEVPYYPRNSALTMLDKYITKRRISGSLEDTIKLFESEEKDSVELSELSSELREKLSGISPGWFLSSLSHQSVAVSCIGYFSAKKIFLMLSKRES